MKPPIVARINALRHELAAAEFAADDAEVIRLCRQKSAFTAASCTGAGPPVHWCSRAVSRKGSSDRGSSRWC
jgi:hypothetical protein